MTSKVAAPVSKATKSSTKKLTKKRKHSQIAPTDYDSDSEPESQLDENEARLSDDEEFPISDDEDTNVPAEEDTITGWASAMTKVLKTKGNLTENRSLILSKATKFDEIEKKKLEAKKAYNFEVTGEVIKEEKPSPLELTLESKKQLLAEKNKRKHYFKSLRMKPNIVDLDRERSLKKIATKGCVQLFNAVRSQQKDLNQQLESTKLEYKKDEIIKGLDKKRFLGTLMGGKRSKSELIDNPVKDEEMKSEDDDDDSEDGQSQKKQGWGALRADFMTGKNTGWDQNSDDDDDDEDEDESGSD